MTTPASEVRARLREYVLRKLAPRGRVSIGDDESLTESGFLDSLSIFQLVAFVEETFRVRIADDEITLDHFGTIADVARLVTAKSGRTARSG